jgi:acrylyl-CoA reductase (NADPH)
MTIRALIVEKDEDGTTRAACSPSTRAVLPEAEVTVAVEVFHRQLQGRALMGPGAGLVKKYPHVPGVDFAGTVEASSDPRYAPGDKVVLTGWRVGEAHWGGYAQKARVRADWLVPLPKGLTTRGRRWRWAPRGLTAMLAVMALEDHGLAPGHGPVLVTGAAGGVGSVAVAMLARLGHEVAAVTGRPEQEAYLRDLGAAASCRAPISPSRSRPMESETWTGCVDAVGGAVLARVTKQLKYRCSVAVVGNAGGLDVPLSIIPFLLRGVNLLGIDSVLQPYANRARLGAHRARAAARQARGDGGAGDARRPAGARARDPEGCRCAGGWSSTSTPEPPASSNEQQRRGRGGVITPDYVRTMAAYNAEMNRRVYAAAGG